MIKRGWKQLPEQTYLLVNEHLGFAVHKVPATNEKFIKYRSSAFISKEYVGCKMKLDDFPNSLHLIRLVLSVCRTTQLCDLAIL